MYKWTVEKFTGAMAWVVDEHNKSIACINVDAAHNIVAQHNAIVDHYKEQLDEQTKSYRLRLDGERSVS